MFAFHYHCDMLFRGSGGNSDSMYLRGCNATLFFSFYFLLFIFFYLSSFSLKQRMQLLESHVVFFSPRKTSHSLTKNALSYISVSHRLHHRVSVSSASLPSLFRISGLEKREKEEKKEKSICRLIF